MYVHFPKIYVTFISTIPDDKALRPEQNGPHLTDNICFLHDNCRKLIQMSLYFFQACRWQYSTIC